MCLKRKSPTKEAAKGCTKDKHISAQMKRVFVAFAGQPKTMKMVSIETGIDRANICRYVAKWRKSNQIKVVKKGICKISKYRAGFLSTSFHPQKNQIS